MQTYACRTRGGSAENDVSRVPTKQANIPLNPLQNLALVTEAIVCYQKIAVREESIRANTVVEIYDNNLVTARRDQSTGVVIRVG